MGDTMSHNLFGLNLKEEITVTDLLTAWGISGTKVEQLGKTNMIYRKDNLICYLLIDVLYSIEIKEGKFDHLEIGMSKRKIFKKLGKTDIDTLPTREILEYNYGNGINYIMTLELKNNRLTKIIISRKI
jgi:hypothetical protein